MRTTDPSPSRSPAPLGFVVGRNAQGQWVATEIHGTCGGLFVSEAAALRYATGEAGGDRTAVRRAGTAIDLRL